MPQIAKFDVGEYKLTHASGSNKQVWNISDAVYIVFELQMMGRGTVWNVYIIDNNKEYSITLHLVGYTEKNKLQSVTLQYIQTQT